jgi:hypothetical protein
MLIELRIKALHVKLRTLITEGGYATCAIAAAFADAVTTWAQQLQDAVLHHSDDCGLREIEERNALDKLIDAEVNEQVQKAQDRETAAWAAAKRATAAYDAAADAAIEIRQAQLGGTAAERLREKLGV